MVFTAEKHIKNKTHHMPYPSVLDFGKIKFEKSISRNWIFGGFQLLDLTTPELKSHVIPYKFKSSHWLKLQHSD